MADQGASTGNLSSQGLAEVRRQKGPPPVHLWNPPDCGMMNMRIAVDGTWWHEGSPIGRSELVRLFASILRLDPDGYKLVTPGEKVGITVEDAPFVAVDATRDDEGRVVFTTNVGDAVTAGADHPVRVTVDADGTPRPYVMVRRGLEARIDRKTFYRLVEEAEDVGGRLVLRSGEATFDLGTVT